MPEERYWDEWSERSPISWWNEGRAKLNVIIRLVNEWTLDGRPESESPRILRRIEMGLQTFAGPDCGASWGDVLVEMRDYVRASERLP
jgi:hypothetical protein